MMCESAEIIGSIASPRRATHTRDLPRPGRGRRRRRFSLAGTCRGVVSPEEFDSTPGGRHMRSLSGRFTVVLILLASTWPATRALGADRFVSAVGNDTANDCLTSLTPCRTLAHALAQAASSDTIDVAGGTYQEPPLLIDFTTTLTFSGGWTPDFGSRDPVLNPTVLDGAGQAELLDVSAGAGGVVDVTVDGFTVRNGEGVAGGAVVQTIGAVKMGHG